MSPKVASIRIFILLALFPALARLDTKLRTFVIATAGRGTRERLAGGGAAGPSAGLSEKLVP